MNKFRYVLRINPALVIGVFLLLGGAAARAQSLQSFGVYDGQDLEGIDFTGENGSNGSFIQTNLSGANLTSVNLEGANLTNAYVDGGAILANTNFTGATLDGAQLDGEDLTTAYFVGATFFGTNLSGANLSNNTTLAANVFEYASMNGANVANTDFTSCDLTGVDLRNSNAAEAITDTQLASASSIESIDLAGNNLSGFNLSGLDLGFSTLNNGTNLTNVNFSNTTLDGAYMDGEDLRSANFTGASLQSAYLPGANLANNQTLAGDNLSFTNLNGASLNGADLTDATLASASLRGADLTNATLTGVNLDHTELPSAMPILPVIPQVTVEVDAPLTVAGATTVSGSGTLLIDATGQLNTSSLSLDPNGSLTLTLGGTGAGTYGQIFVTDDPLALTGTLNIELSGGFEPGAGDTFQLLSDASLNGQFSAENLPALGPHLAWDDSELDSTGELIVVDPVPEPGMVGLWGCAGALLLARRLRQKRGRERA